MYTVDHCISCRSLDVETMPAFLTQFILWRTTGIFHHNHLTTSAIKCRNCGYVGCMHRLTDEEEGKLYKDYRGEEYTNQRIHLEPWYPDAINSMNSARYKEDRLRTINDVIDKNIDRTTISSVLDYGGDDGSFIPTRFIKAKKFVYDISGVKPTLGVSVFDPLSHSHLKFDFIMCCHVLEHKSDPDVVIKDIIKYTNENTWMYWEVPNFDCPPMPGGVFHEHLNIFNFKSLSSLLGRYNLEIIDVLEKENLSILTKLRK